ncbi:MAG: hypothetical protein SH850_21380, partial [Planctomycetaceae bacterium]|nr:hypothetical protein [Planctomycetaceae bacterium]
MSLAEPRLHPTKTTENVAPIGRAVAPRLRYPTRQRAATTNDEDLPPMTADAANPPGTPPAAAR